MASSTPSSCSSSLHSRSESQGSVGVASVPFDHQNVVGADGLGPLGIFGVGVDIGGTLTKIVYFEDGSDNLSEESAQFKQHVRAMLESEQTYGETGHRDDQFDFFSSQLQGRFCFMYFETRTMDGFLEMIKQENILRPSTVLCATGGGARKYAKAIRELLGIDLARTDELQCLIDGVNLILQQPIPELYKINHRDYLETRDRHYFDNRSDLFPLLLVNIGSGVSILKVNADGTHQRVGGTAIGGATFYGLAASITDCASFDDALNLAAEGDSRNVDLLVGDIYGGDYEEYGLTSKTVAASMGKLVRPKDRAKARDADVARGLLDCVTNNIGSLALLHARQQGLNHVVFAGNFLRGNDISMVRLTAAFEFWSKGEMTAMFLRHEGYLGAIGALAYGAAQRTTCGAQTGRR
eukprot:TRINITY_DN9876_c0_g1_i3.p1 TRINITY_DN9876_c0_g1~~TRINITY_DN9876_c0_g1_i3.p1  ORF type:complete len:409 (+),score=97.39 TRINITY_DN9876_c0_g1_i3:141-1367(+)